MKQLAINWHDLEGAFENSFAAYHYYFDLETGRVILVTDEIRWKLDDIFEEWFDSDADEEDGFQDMLSSLDLDDWEQESIADVFHVEQHFGSRVIEVPQITTHEAYADMEAFSDTIQMPHLQNQMAYAIQGRGAFGRFRRVLSNHLYRAKTLVCFSAKPTAPAHFGLVG